MIETAMVFPVIIIVVISLIYLMFSMYERVCLSSRLHMDLLNQAGIITGNYIEERQQGDFIMYQGIRGERKSLIGQGYVSVPQGFMFMEDGPAMESRVYVIDEKSEIRIWDFLGDMADECL